MRSASLPPNERERLAVLHDLGVLDTPEVASFDDIAKLAAQIAGVPIALVSLVDRDRQWFKAHHGLAARETPRDYAFCAHALLQQDQLFVVGDARADERFRDNPLVTADPNVVFYAGAPLVVDAHAVGTLCLIDHAPRALAPEAADALRILARQVEAQLVLARSVRDKNTAIEELVRAQADAARLARVVDLMPHLVLVYARDASEDPFRLVSRNDAAAREQTHPGNLDIGRLARDIHPPDVAADLVLRLGRAARSVDVPGERVRYLREIRGQTFQIDAIALTRNAVAIVAENVTQRVAFERSKDEFLAIAAHELRTPLSGMIGGLGLLSSGVLGDLTPSALEAVAIAETSALRLNRLTTDMLDLETMRQGKLTLRTEPVTMSELVSLTLPPLRAAAAKTGVTLAARGELEASIELDRDRIVQALTNLVANAIRYAPANSEVTVTATQSAHHLRIEVADVGRGISATDQERLFSRFVQLEASVRRPHEGTGLGLAIVKALVELHRGTVGVESDPSVRPGTRFWIELPR